MLSAVDLALPELAEHCCCGWVQINVSERATTLRAHVDPAAWGAVIATFTLDPCHVTLSPNPKVKRVCRISRDFAVPANQVYVLSGNARDFAKSSHTHTHTHSARQDSRGASVGPSRERGSWFGSTSRAKDSAS